MASKSQAYSISCTAKTIDSLYDLKPGDHIQVNGEICSSGSALYAHHMLVVEVVSDSQIRVIHKINRVVEQVRSYNAEEITVLEYECQYTGQEAIERARERMDEGYNLLRSNCEHFVTEVKTGVAQSVQVRDAAAKTVGIAIGVGLIGAAAAGLAYLFIPKRNKDREDD